MGIQIQHSHTSYRLSGLWQKFRARPFAWQKYYLLALLRWLLRFRLFDSHTPVLLGRGVHIEKRHGRITTGGVCSLKNDCRLGVVGTPEQIAHLHIGEGTEIGQRTVINVRESVQIGDLCCISWDCNISDTDFHQIVLAGGKRPQNVAPIVIEDHVWVGSGVTICKGVHIGAHSVVSASAVVHRDMPSHSLIAGNPARPISKIDGWER
jgi:acetyltransferase-like isoleucine patch superfamily enzyme